MEEYFTKADLRKRGWAEALIEKFLPQPDKKETNPYNKNYSEMCLYSVKRVKSIEWSEAFREALKNRRKPGRKRA